LAGDDAPPDWRTGFFNSKFFGDYLNQTMVAAGEKALIPEDFRVPLPNRNLASAWDK
jgi:hypothetical protein